MVLKNKQSSQSTETDSPKSKGVDARSKAIKKPKPQSPPRKSAIMRRAEEVKEGVAEQHS